MNVCKGFKIDGTKCTKRTNDETGYCHIHKDKHIEEKPSECPICIEKFSRSDKRLSCGHWIHLNCIRKSLKAECPICRCPLSLPEKIVKEIENNAKEMKNEWEREEEENLIREQNEFLMQHPFEIIAEKFYCKDCIEEYMEDLTMLSSFLL